MGDQGAAFLKDYNLSQLNGVRDSIKKINIIDKLNLKDKIKHLVTDAYQGNRAKLTPLLEKIDNFYTLQNKIKGNLNLIEHWARLGEIVYNQVVKKL